MMLVRWVKVTAMIVAGLSVLIVVVSYLVDKRPEPSEYAPWLTERIDLPSPHPQYSLRVSFLGTTTILLDDGRNAVMTDGFFTRPHLGALLGGRIQPNVDSIRRALKKAGVERLDAVIPVHSHHDHAMDAPEVARQTGALLMGSASTRMIGLGWGLPDSQIQVVETGHSQTFGNLRVHWLASPHSRVPALIGRLTGIGQSIDKPLTTPARLTDYCEGQTFSVLIEHPAGNVLIHGSAAVDQESLEGVKADVVFLGIATLARQPEVDQVNYVQEVVIKTGARLVVPVHWDDFTRSSEEPLIPMPYLADDLGEELRFLQKQLEPHPQISMHLLPMSGQVVFN
jgi:L-ascorbate metabolism protein UlaG (beta-lactamase superfamily)